MKAFGLTLRVAGATLILLALQALWRHLWVGVPFTSELGLLALSALFVVLALSLVAANSQQQGWKLSGTFFVLYFGVNGLNSLDEALLFRVGLQHGEVFRLTAAGFCTSLIFAPLLVPILGCWKRRRHEEKKPLLPRSAAGWAARIVLGDFLYVLFYSIARVAASPFVKDFYAGFKLLGSAGIIEIEVLRGLIYVAAGLAVASGMKGERGRAAATLGLAFPVLAGVSPLLLHNPYLPDYIRLAHGFEIAIANLAYGALLGHILTRKAVPVSRAQHADSTEPSA